MPNERKIQIVKDLKEKLSKAHGIVMTDYQGLSVPEVETLRKSLQEVGAKYQIAKNTLLKLALDKDEKFTGPTAVVLSYEDEIKPLKVLYDFAKKHKNLKIKGGLFEGEWEVGEKLKEIAVLPSREELLGKFLGMIQSPLTRLVGVVKGNQRGLVGVLRARAGDLNG